MTRCVLYDTNMVGLAWANSVGDTCTFNYNLTANTTYVLAHDANGSSYHSWYTGSAFPHPVQSDYINFSRRMYNDTGTPTYDTGYAQGLQHIYVELITAGGGGGPSNYSVTDNTFDKVYVV